MGEILEIADALGIENIKDVVTFPPRRVAFFETIVSLVTEAALKHEVDLYPAFRAVYQEHVVACLKTKDEITKLTTEEALLAKVDHEIGSNVDQAFEIFHDPKNHPMTKKLEDYVTNIKNISQRILANKYTPTPPETLESITKKAVFDIFYKEEMAQEIQSLVNPIVTDLLDKKALSCTSTETSEPYTLGRIKTSQEPQYIFMTLGAPATGKSTGSALSEYKALRLGISPEDLVTISKDIYRALVSDPRELGENIENHSIYNQDEASIVTELIFDRLKQKSLDRNVLFEGVSLDAKKVDLAKGGSLHIVMMTAEPEISLERAKKRGDTTGRYVTNKTIFKAFKDISTTFFPVIGENKDQKIEFTVYDNSQEGRTPTKIFEGFTYEINPDNCAITDTPHLAININNQERFVEFMNNQYINVNATSKEDKYIKDYKPMTFDECKKIVEGYGFTVYADEAVETKAVETKTDAVTAKTRSLKEALQRQAKSEEDSAFTGTSKTSAKVKGR
jgi:adenylate kinase family enzyme